MKIRFLRYHQSETSTQIFDSTYTQAYIAPHFLHIISHSDMYSLFADAQQLRDGSRFPSHSENRRVPAAFCFQAACPAICGLPPLLNSGCVYETFATGESWWKESFSVSLSVGMFEWSPEIYFLRKVVWVGWVKFRGRGVILSPL